MTGTTLPGKAGTALFLTPFILNTERLVCQTERRDLRWGGTAKPPMELQGFFAEWFHHD